LAARKAPRSVGAPNKGKLEGASKLRKTKHLVQRTGALQYGLPDLTQLLKRVGERVAKKHAGAVMLVGDLSAKEGGSVRGHNSHQSGRDADIGFFVANSKGKA